MKLYVRSEKNGSYTVRGVRYQGKELARHAQTKEVGPEDLKEALMYIANTVKRDRSPHK